MPALKSWFPIPKSSHFSLANIPFGIISTASKASPRPAVAIGDHVLDLQDFTANDGFSELEDIDLSVFSQPTLNAFAALGRPTHSKVRKYIQDVFVESTPLAKVLKDQPGLRESCLVAQSAVKMHLPMSIGDYTDFYVGKNHALTCGVMMRGKDNALHPNYHHLPVGYHGRASSVVVSGTPIRRPKGQIVEDPQASNPKPMFSACKRLDFELEMGAFICKANALGDAVPIAQAADHIFGLVMLNDWSARDIQFWEYIPLGPFNGKNFGTSISPWVVLIDALEPFATKGIDNEAQVLDYLKEEKQNNCYDLKLEVDLIPEGSKNATTIVKSNGKHLLFSFPQMLAHHTAGGCNMNVGDILGSGTISGPNPGSEGCLLELTKGGKETFTVEESVQRKFLEDGDEVIFRGVCGDDPVALVGFGEVRGKILSVK